MSFAAPPSQAKGPQPLTRVPPQRADYSSKSKQERADQQRQSRVAFTQHKRVQVVAATRQKLKAAAALAHFSHASNRADQEEGGSTSGEGDSCDSSQGGSNEEASDEENEDSGSSSEDETNPSAPAHLSSLALARYTRRPSPISIPRNAIGLTYLHSFLSATECTKLIELAEGGFSRSVVGFRGPAYESPIRTSHSAELDNRHPVVAGVRARVAELSGARDSQIETISVVRYEPGQQYLPHYDSSHGDDSPRSHTVFAYLNDVPEGGGGETEFTQLGVKFKPKRGDALFWENRADKKSYHKDGIHAGRPPVNGVKYGLNIWIAFDDVKE